MKVCSRILIAIALFLKGTPTKGQNVSTTTIFPLPSPVPNPDEELDNDAFIKNFDEAGYRIACEWMTISDPEKIVLNLDREMSYEDVCKLTFLNKGHKLWEFFLEVPESLKWKRNIINLIWSLYETACPNEFVNHDYMNIMRELAIVYLNSVEPREDVNENEDVWTRIEQTLIECGKKGLPPHNFTSGGLLIKKLILPEIIPVAQNDDTVSAENSTTGSSGETNPNLMDLEIQVENAETVYKLDTIIDNMWYVFSHAWARCLNTVSSKDLWGPRFKQLFFKDFLAPLEKRWANPGEMRPFLDVIVGNFDVSRMQHNIPYCTQAAYINPGGTHLESQLVRPIKLAEISRGVSKFQNSRA